MQARHWWFVGRRRILSEIIAQLPLPPRAEILEIGCGTGGNLAMLAAFGQVRAMEYDQRACAMARELTGMEIATGGLPEPVPFPDGAFDLVCLLDVLEHIEDDRAALARAARLLKPDGRLLVTVPAYGWLWSGHDTAHHHVRRYTATSLRRCCQRAGLTVRRLGYCNTLLFPLIAAIRLAGRLAGRGGRQASDLHLPPAWLNRLLTAIFGLERHLARRCLLPWGTSVVAVLAPPAA